MALSAHCLIRIAYNKTRLLLIGTGLFLVLPFSLAYGQVTLQKPNQIVAHLAFGGNFHHRTAKVEGASTPAGKTSVMAGGAYQRQLTPRFYVSGGLAYSRHAYTVTADWQPDSSPTEAHAQVELISIPLIARMDLGKFLFINAGPSVDFEVNRFENAHHSRQSGIGMSAGIGARYRITNVTLWANPFFKRHAVIPFNSQQHPAKLNVAALAIGVDYRF